MEQATPNIQSWSDILHFIGASRYRVERAFDRLSPDFRDLLLAIGGLEKADLTAGHLSGARLHHYTQAGQLKIARALRKVRLLSNAFPQGIREGEFTQIDRRQGVHHE